LGPVPLDGLGLGGAILLPVAGVVGTPLSSAVAADFAILWIEGELLLTVLAAALLLTPFTRAYGLFRVKSGRFELPPAETAMPLIHPFRVTAPADRLRMVMYESRRQLAEHVGRDLPRPESGLSPSTHQGKPRLEKNSAFNCGFGVCN
jgi:hypothetical protein